MQCYMCSHAMPSHKHMLDTGHCCTLPCSNKPEHIYCNRKSILEPEVGQLTKLVRGRRWGRTGQDRVVLSCNDPGIVTRTIQISTAYIVTIFGDLCYVLTLSDVC